MSGLTRILVVGAAVVAMSLAPTAAVAQPHTHDEAPTTEQELAQRWNDYNQSTRVAPAELEAGRRAEAARRALAEKWDHYYHSTRIPPAELTARAQARAGPANATEPPAQATPARPDGSTEQLGWLIVPLAVLVVLVTGLAVLAARFSGGPLRIRPA
jgi:hypothetical protein